MQPGIKVNTGPTSGLSENALLELWLLTKLNLWEQCAQSLHMLADLSSSVTCICVIMCNTPSSCIQGCNSIVTPAFAAVQRQLAQCGTVENCWPA